MDKSLDLANKNSKSGNVSDLVMSILVMFQGNVSDLVMSTFLMFNKLIINKK